MEEQVSSETPVATSPLPASKTGKKPWLPIVLLLVLLLIITGAVFAGFQIGKKQTPKTPSEILFNQPTVGVPTPTPGLTEGWRTYTNDKMKFSIKYPPDWFAHKETRYPIAEGRSSERYEAVFSFPIDNPSPQDFIDEQKAAINITYTPKPEMSFISYINKLMSQDWGATPYQSETLVANIKATVIGIGNPPKNKYVIFDKNGWYFISFGVEKNETYEKYSQLFDQVLATFKFLDSSQTDATAGWKTYTNTKINFQFKYPDIWDLDEYVDKHNNIMIRFFPVGLAHDTSLGSGIISIESGNDTRSLDYIKSEYYPNAIKTTIGGKQALRDDKGLFAIVKINDENSIEIRGSLSKENDEAIKYFDQILSTFKFIQ